MNYPDGTADGSKLGARSGITIRAARATPLVAASAVTRSEPRAVRPTQRVRSPGSARGRGAGRIREHRQRQSIEHGPGQATEQASLARALSVQCKGKESDPEREHRPPPAWRRRRCPCGSCGEREFDSNGPAPPLKVMCKPDRRPDHRGFHLGPNDKVVGSGRHGMFQSSVRAGPEPPRAMGLDGQSKDRGASGFAPVVRQFRSAGFDALDDVNPVSSDHRAGAS